MIETRAKLSGAEALIAHLQLTIEKMKHAMFGPRLELQQSASCAGSRWVGSHGRLLAPIAAASAPRPR